MKRISPSGKKKKKNLKTLNGFSNKITFIFMNLLKQTLFNSLTHLLTWIRRLSPEWIMEEGRVLVKI